MNWLRNLVVALSAVLVIAGTLATAEARRARLPVIVPGVGSGGLGSSETLVKVMDLPRRPELVYEDGSEINLGYLFKRDGSGQWVGHIGSKTKYLTIKPEFEAEFLQLAGLPDFPEPPARSASRAGTSSGSFSIFLIGALAVGMVGAVIVVLRRRTARADSSPNTDNGGGEWAEALSTRIADRAASPASASVASAPSRPMAARPVRQARLMSGGVPVGARPAFGRRG